MDNLKLSRVLLIVSFLLSFLFIVFWSLLLSTVLAHTSFILHVFFLLSIVFSFVSLILKIIAFFLLKNPLNADKGGVLAIIAGVLGGFDVLCIIAGVVAFYSQKNDYGRKKKSEWVMSGI